MRRRRASWFGFWADSMALGMETQTVIGLRLAKIALGGPKAKIETSRMVTEKIHAALAAQRGLATSMLTGKGESAHHKLVRLYRRRVRANGKRLTKAR